MSNALMPSGAPAAALGPASSPSPAPRPSISDALGAAHSSAAALFASTAKATAQASSIRNELAELSRLGDSVTPEDVIEGAAKLVGEGLDPMQMAGVLANMPTASGALAPWVEQHLQAMDAHLPQLAQTHAVARHELGMSALRGIVGHAVGGQAAGPPPSSAPAVALGAPS